MYFYNLTTSIFADVSICSVLLDVGASIFKLCAKCIKIEILNNKYAKIRMSLKKKKRNYFYFK
jgi:hypothetical protein